MRVKNKMKKFCNKITKQQWRVTVPNINTTLFKKVPLKDAISSDKVSSGSYDLQEAQLEYDKSRSLPTSVYITDEDSTDTDDEKFEDARGMSEKYSSGEINQADHELYSDVAVCNNLNKSNSKFEYDVPKISFKFFETKQQQQDEDEECYENINVENTDDGNVKLIYMAPLEEDSSSEKFVSQTEIHFQNTLHILKSGSDPNIVLRKPNDDDENDDEEDNDDFYKIPRSLKIVNRLSQSLNNFDVDNLQPISTSSNHSSIEHISCSQVLVLENAITNESITEQKIESHSSSKLSLRLRKPVKLLKKPKLAVNNKWNNFRTKFHNLMAEHAAQQRVGAFNDKEKITINFEEMYKHSKTKCLKVFENTSKIFNKTKRTQDNSDSVVGLQEECGVNNKKGELTARDIEYKLNICEETKEEDSKNPNKENKCDEITYVKSNFGKRNISVEGQNGFEDLRRYIKQGGDFCKELSTILQDRADAETQYAKSLSKLSTKLSRACRDGVGGLNEAWKSVALELEARAEGHRLMGAALLEETAKPLRTLTESQHRVRKNSETAVDKAARLLADWRASEAKSKKSSHTCARDNEKLQDAALLDTNKYGKITLSRSTSLIQLAHMHNKNTADKDNAKLEGKKRKAEDAVKKADIEYYSLCVRAERARLEWESAVLRGVSTFQTLEEERLNSLKSVLNAYLHHSSELGPRLIEATEKLKNPIADAEPGKDLSAFLNLRQSSQQVSEQLLPDFYCEHITLAMNRERRKQALVKLLQLVRLDIERERKSKNGLENLSKAIKQTPNFGAEDSQQSVTEKLYHMKSMLTYLEGARYKIQSALAELDSRPRSGHPLAPHITITRDKTGLQQSVLKVPQWLKDEWFEESDRSPVSEKSDKSNQSNNSDLHINDVEDADWTDRGAADGNSNQPDSDFDDFSSQCSSAGGNMCVTEEHPVVPIAKCKALYAYTPNLTDELSLRPGDILSVYRQQDDGWWLGECNGNVGIFPATYVEIVPS